MKLEATLTTLLSDHPTPSGIRDFANLCHQIATIYVRRKARGGRLCSTRLGLSLEDLAWDCVAELFQRNEKGVVTKLTSYFGAMAWESKSEGELEGATRRLVFGAVNHSLYRIHREHDCSLGKVLRNLKNAVKSSPHFTLIERKSETWLCLKQEGEPANSLPHMPPEFLEQHLSASLRGDANLKQVLSTLAEILANQSEYRNCYPLTGLALIIRSAFVNLHQALEQESNGHDELAAGEIEKMIAISVASVKSRMHSSYVGKQKVEVATYEAYFSAIGDMLFAEYVQNDGFDRSYYDYLRQHVQELTREDYQRRYRCHFEYLAKLSRKELLDNLKEEW